MPERITLYTAKICPYAHRVEIALAEAKAQFTRYEIDLQNKPEWYAPKVNPASKVPAIAYGGPDVPPDQPSPESVKLAESLVLVEFVADLFPASGLLPTDPVQRAKARFFIEAVSSKFIPAWYGLLLRNAPADELYAALEHLQALLPAEGGFAVGAFSIADVAIAPFLARARLSLLNEIGKYPEGEGKKIWANMTSGKLARIGKYAEDLFARESFKATFDEAHVVEAFRQRFAHLRSQ
ncbi:glutathione transferase omega class [Trametes coccinea BRFM310]|uniref:Glutathione transferase omega class n=1 Tax=Trametes coccinea (strain BRFM310) TaxID=1353009 RepID=A0A1Y2INC2_TRAC3|nr:glutathione transferase omega class [Trametes coccinea BRFM310]